jgi:hypothetical protein
MKRVILALIIGLAMGYHWGYDEGVDGKPSIMARALEHFGATRIKAAQDAQNKRVEDATKP